MTRRERGHRSLVDQLVREDRTGRRRFKPVLLLWRWRWELGAVAALAGLVHVTDSTILLIAATPLVVLCAAVPALRRPALERFWCIATQHRLRVGLRESDVRSWSGRMPAIVWTSASAGGERVLVACPAGVDVARIDAARGELAAACWAMDMKVRPHPRHANLAVVEVVRRREQP